MSSSHQQTEKKSAPPLPSPQEALRHTLSSYFEATLNKVAVFLGEPRKAYKDLSDQQLFSRGYFLHYIYECLAALLQLSQLQGQGSSVIFKGFLTGLFFREDDLTRVTRINEKCVFQGNPLSQHIMELLFQTEFYVYQILLRVLLVKLVFEEHEKALQMIEEINQRCIFPEYFTDDPKLMAPKRDRLKLKQVFKEVQFLHRLYHCQLSINRQNCVSRPEVNCLLHLLKKKLSPSVLEYVRKHINFKCQGELPPPSSLEKYQPLPQLPLHQNPPKPIKPPVTEIVQFTSNDASIEVPPSPQQSPRPNIFTRKAQQSPLAQQYNEEPPQINQIQYTEEQLRTPPRKVRSQYDNNSPMDIPKKDRPFLLKKDSEARGKDSDSAVSKKSSDLIDANLPEFKYERRQQPERTPSERPHSKKHKHIPVKEQFKAYRHNQRFANTQHSIKYTIPKTKSSRKKREEEKLNRIANPGPPAAIIYAPVKPPNKKDEDSGQSFLAEETPVHRNRTYIQPNNPKPTL